MRGTTTPDLRVSVHSIHRSGWRGIGWKLLVAAFILLLMLVGISASPSLLLVLTQIALLLWGALFVGLVAGRLFTSNALPIRIAWCVLSIGAYASLAVLGVSSGASRMLEVLPPFAALTLVAHLGRRDLPVALRDWAMLMALCLYASFGVMSVWLIVSSFGFAGVVAVLLPPILFEGLVLIIRRVDPLRDSKLAHLAALLLATSLAVAAFSWGLLNPNTSWLASLIFDLLTGLLVGGALLVGWLTRRLLEPQASTAETSHGGVDLGRDVVELSHGLMLIALTIYLALRLFGLAITPG